VNVPTGLIAVITDGGPIAGVTGIETAGALDGADWPSVVAVAVGDSGPAVPPGMLTTTLTGGRLAPRWAVACVVQVTCWPLVRQVQPSPVAEVTVWPDGTVMTSVVVPVVGPVAVTFAW
jgi:hypothetical protein